MPVTILSVSKMFKSQNMQGLVEVTSTVKVLRLGQPRFAFELLIFYISLQVSHGSSQAQDPFCAPSVSSSDSKTSTDS
jgi:hypothetical protein